MTKLVSIIPLKTSCFFITYFNNKTQVFLWFLYLSNIVLSIWLLLIELIQKEYIYCDVVRGTVKPLLYPVRQARLSVQSGS